MIYFVNPLIGYSLEIYYSQVLKFEKLFYIKFFYIYDKLYNYKRYIIRFFKSKF